MLGIQSLFWMRTNRTRKFKEFTIGKRKSILKCGHGYDRICKFHFGSNNVPRPYSHFSPFGLRSQSLDFGKKTMLNVSTHFHVDGIISLMLQTWNRDTWRPHHRWCSISPMIHTNDIKGCGGLVHKQLGMRRNRAQQCNTVQTIPTVVMLPFKAQRNSNLSLFHMWDQQTWCKIRAEFDGEYFRGMIVVSLGS